MALPALCVIPFARAYPSYDYHLALVFAMLQVIKRVGRCDGRINGITDLRYWKYVKAGDDSYCIYTRILKQSWMEKDKHPTILYYVDLEADYRLDRLTNTKVNRAIAEVVAWAVATIAQELAPDYENY